MHVAAAALIQASQTAVIFMLPVLAKKYFHANHAEVLIVTAAPTVCFALSIFWNDYFERRGTGRYLAVYWLVCCLPVACGAFASNVWMVIVPHVIASIGGPGYYPVAGALLKRLYTDKRRGSVYGVLYGSVMTAGALAGYGVGVWLHNNPESFRIFLPIASGAQLAGVLMLGWLAHATGMSRERTVRTNEPGTPRLGLLLDPILHMGTVLKQDPVFARYEAAYMTYGVGWMIAYALVPLLATEGLGLGYEEIASSTTVPYQIAIVLALVPAGWLMDRMGAVRSTAISFAMLALYPFGLIWALEAHTVRDLAIASAWYGVAHAGANIGWMLGPVALAPSPDRVPKYVAIHATMVGLRGAVFQGLGVLLYEVTKSFTWPLALAGAAYVWSAYQMWTLHGRVGSRGTRAPDIAAAKEAVIPETDH